MAAKTHGVPLHAHLQTVVDSLRSIIFIHLDDARVDRVEQIRRRTFCSRSRTTGAWLDIPSGL
jgi:hypothetical protein